MDDDKYFLQDGVMVPTEDEIARQAAKIREGWNEAQLARSLGKMAGELRAESTWTPPMADWPEVGRKNPAE